MAVNLPAHVLQRMDQEAQGWMDGVRNLLASKEYEGLQQKVRNSILSFGTFDRPVFLYAGSTFSTIQVLLRELFSARKHRDANILMRAFDRVKIASPAIGFYALAIQAIQEAELTAFLKHCLPEVQKMLFEEKEHFRSQNDGRAIRHLEFLEEKANQLEGTLELQSIMQKQD